MNRKQEDRNRILNDSVWRLMLSMSLPAIIAMSINGLNTFVDALFVGQYVGQNALAAVSLVFPLTMITNGLAAMIGMGSASLLSIAIGNEDESIQEKILGTATLLSLMTSIALSVLGWVFAPELLALMGGSGEIQSMGVSYYRIMLIGSFFRIYGVAINMLIRAEGKVSESMVYNSLAAILNIILNAFFVIYLEMGVEGAAWATVIAMLVLSLLNVWYFYIAKKASFAVSFRGYSFERKFLSPILSVGISAMLLQGMFFVQQVVVFRSLAYYGGDWDITFMGACYRIMLLVLLPGFGFTQALQPIVGVNFGAGDHERVKKAFRVFLGAFSCLALLCCVFVIFIPSQILGWMIPDTEFSHADIWNFQLMMSSLVLTPYFLMTTTLFQGIGKGNSASFILISREILIFIPIVLLLPIWFEISGIYASAIPVNVLITGACYLMVQKQFRSWKVKA
ncbi:MAG: MATE family efflux transporter [Bacteroidota bacterium]